MNDANNPSEHDSHESTALLPGDMTFDGDLAATMDVAGQHCAVSQEAMSDRMLDLLRRFGWDLGLEQLDRRLGTGLGHQGAKGRSITRQRIRSWTSDYSQYQTPLSGPRRQPTNILRLLRRLSSGEDHYALISLPFT
jgi:hypothetical protein